jgi:chromosome segregation ATPase
MAYENENNGIDGDINSLMEDIASLEAQGSNAQSDLNGLQKDIAEVGGLAEKFKSEAIHYHKSTQAEIMRNNDLTKVLNQAENTYRLRINQVDEGNKEISGLAGENDKLGSMNGNLREDIEYCRRHL